ncbi:hypothetical protein PISMIDRAFT_17573 [Pisolithus microcarpus 441]|uniref:Uncharacterized protein n=1 Tax=Pisolithus microcarpus 441 TaxID=765257 RepID=A0A0C9YV60_9AGAM|nr:hypothetical protein PISMIDRAFT_17573 [Pisolithus microcarpus 441]
MHSQDSPSCGPPEASSFLRRPEELRRFLDDIIKLATAAKSLLETHGGLREARAAHLAKYIHFASSAVRKVIFEQTVTRARSIWPRESVY